MFAEKAFRAMINISSALNFFAAIAADKKFRWPFYKIFSFIHKNNMINKSNKKIISVQEGELLLKLARQTLENYFKKNKIEFDNLPEALSNSCGAFVTLKINNHLRGCIGLIESKLPLYRTIRQMTLEAAFNDPRFRPLEAEELKNLKIEISVLSKPEKINSAAEIELGADGVIVKSGDSSGVFLPQVAKETGWDLTQFMDHLCSDKANLPPDAWQKDQCEIYTFKAQIFKEKLKNK